MKKLVVLLAVILCGCTSEPEKMAYRFRVSFEDMPGEIWYQAAGDEWVSLGQGAMVLASLEVACPEA